VVTPGVDGGDWDAEVVGEFVDSEQSIEAFHDEMVGRSDFKPVSEVDSGRSHETSSRVGITALAPRMSGSPGAPATRGCAVSEVESQRNGRLLETALKAVCGLMSTARLQPPRGGAGVHPAGHVEAFVSHQFASSLIVSPCLDAIYGV
jgi:hypothetical protein